MGKKLIRQQNLIKAEEEIAELEDCGHTVERFGDFHWRIDDYYDVWPSSKKYMKKDGNGKSGKYNRMKDIFI